jgi:hypothetical protein
MVLGAVVWYPELDHDHEATVWSQEFDGTTWAVRTTILGPVREN